MEDSNFHRQGAETLPRRPRRNRVTPTGEIVALAARGNLMGNRGVIHDETGEIVRPWQSRAWISCVLSYRNKRRPLAEPDRYYPLFFTDEAVALASGHRPCCQCRPDAARAFRDAWAGVYGGPAWMSEIDAVLHRARRTRRKVQPSVAPMPNGSFVRLQTDGPPCLVWDGCVYPWAAGAYGARLKLSTVATVLPLTPDPILQVLHSGYRPLIALDHSQSSGGASGGP